MPESHESSGGFESAALGWLSENRGQPQSSLKEAWNAFFGT